MKVIRVERAIFKYLYRVVVDTKLTNLEQIEINGVIYEVHNYNRLGKYFLVKDPSCSLDSWTKPVLRSVKFKNTVYQF